MVFDLQAVTLYPTHSGNLFSYAPRPVYDVLTSPQPLYMFNLTRQFRGYILPHIKTWLFSIGAIVILVR